MTQALNTKKLEPAITSYDLLKALAVALMIVDHLGFYFYPDILWLRIIGRLSPPIWFFLIGYAHRRDVSRILWAGALILTISGLAAGQSLFPLNILFMLGLARLAIDSVMKRALRRYETLGGMALALFLFSFLGNAILEYSTIGLLFAMLGYLRRHKDELTITKGMAALFAGGAGLAYVLSQWPLMPMMTTLQLLTLAGGLVAVLFILFNFKLLSWNGFRILRPVFHLLGRHTLAIYVVHLLAFQALAMALYPVRFGLFEFTWFSPAHVALFSPG